MAGYDLGTAWIQVAVSGNGLSKSVEGQLNNIDYSKSEKNITSRLGGAFSKVGRIATAALGAAAAIGVGAGFASIASEAISASDATDKFKSTLSFALSALNDGKPWPKLPRRVILSVELPRPTTLPRPRFSLLLTMLRSSPARFSRFPVAQGSDGFFSPFSGER